MQSKIIMDKNKLGFFVVGTILVGIFSRLLPHPPNFTAVGAIALFSGALLQNNRIAYLIPLAALFLSDLVLNNVVYNLGEFTLFYEGAEWIYGSFIIMVLVGRFVITKIAAKNVLLASLLISVFFFITSNTGSWLAQPIYTKDFSGYLAAMSAGLPFFANTLIANVVFSAILFGGFYWLGVRKPLTVAFATK